MIRWIREKFKGAIDKKYRRLFRQSQNLDVQINRLTRQKKRVVAQMQLIEILTRSKHK